MSGSGHPRAFGWGILGCANIARKNISAILSLNASRVALVAIASRSIDKARAFARELGLDEDKVRIYGSYDDLLKDPEVNAVYVPLPTTQHLEWVTKAAEAGKHVLCEKPTAVSLSHLKDMVHACRSRDLLFMDGVMFMHNERLQKLTEYLRQPMLMRCNVKRVEVAFSFNTLQSESFLESDVRTQSSGDPLGAVGDLGMCRYIIN